jgi:hypothetical protein
MGVARLEGVPLEFSAIADAGTHEPYPFVRCRAYVAHGNLDEFADLEESLTWVRHASVNMRRRGMSSDVVKERRLLEVADDHALAASVPALTTKIVEWHGLFGLEAGDLTPRVSADLEERRPQDFARGHGSNFEARRGLLLVRVFRDACARIATDASPAPWHAAGVSQLAHRAGLRPRRHGLRRLRWAGWLGWLAQVAWAQVWLDAA